MNLQEALEWAEEKKVAIGHFNFPNLEILKAIFESAQALSDEAGYKIPILVGTSEGEREFIGTSTALALVRDLRETYDYPIFINADHHKDEELAKGAIDAGYDKVIIDASHLSYEENVAVVKRICDYAKEKGSNTLVEGELGYIGSGSDIKDDIPTDAAITEDKVPSAEEAKKFVEETGLDLLAPAVGNIHGMLRKAKNPNLLIGRIKEVAEATGKPLVLHGGSGVSDSDFVAAIDAGMRVIHISTEIRRAFRESLEKSLADNPDQLAPYKIMPPVVTAVGEVVRNRLKLFTKLES